MKASELIAELNNLIAVHGDREIYTPDYFDCYKLGYEVKCVDLLRGTFFLGGDKHIAERKKDAKAGRFPIVNLAELRQALAAPGADPCSHCDESLPPG